MPWYFLYLEANTECNSIYSYTGRQTLNAMVLVIPGGKCGKIAIVLVISGGKQ